MYTSTPPQQKKAYIARLPRALRPYAKHFTNSPGSHITAFLLLHEITAIVPFAGIFAFLHFSEYTPPGLPGEWIQQGVEKWGSYVSFHF